MSRSAREATRFTATLPHASTKPPASRISKPFSLPHAPSHGVPRQTPSSLPPKTAVNPAETPAQKVARLRAAHDAEKLAQISRWDRIVLRGRVVADVAHRVTTLSLIGFSVVAIGVTIFAAGDMIIHNRRKRNAYFKDLYDSQQAVLIDAYRAAAKGEATDEQVLLIDRERAAQEADRERKKQSWTPWAFIKRTLTIDELGPVDVGAGLLRKEEDEEARREEGVGVTAEAAETASERPAGVLLQAGDETKTSEQVHESREAIHKDPAVEGGPLDKLAAEVAGSRSGGWTNWFSSK